MAVELFKFGSGHLCKITPCDEVPEIPCCQACFVEIDGVDITGTGRPLGPNDEDILRSYGFCFSGLGTCQPCQDPGPGGSPVVSTETCYEANCIGIEDAMGNTVEEEWRIAVRIKCGYNAGIIVVYEGETTFRKPCPPDGDGVYEGTVDVFEVGNGDPLVCSGIPYKVTCRVPCEYTLEETGAILRYNSSVVCIQDEKVIVTFSAVGSMQGETFDCTIIVDGVVQETNRCLVEGTPLSANVVHTREYKVPNPNPDVINLVLGPLHIGSAPECEAIPNTQAQEIWTKVTS